MFVNLIRQLSGYDTRKENSSSSILNFLEEENKTILRLRETADDLLKNLNLQQIYPHKKFYR